MYKHFEDISVWKDARTLVNSVYELIERCGVRRDFVLNDQLKRSSISIMLNIAEGFERKSVKEFANFLNIAKGSAGEVRSILYVLKDQYHLKDDEFMKFKSDVESISSQLHGLRNYLIRNN